MSATKKKAPLYQGFVEGAVGASSGAIVSHPLDLLKVRMQIAGEMAKASKADRPGMISIAKDIVSNQGVKGLYAGLTASIARQIMYSGTRFGVYDIIKQSVQKPGKELALYEKVGAALGAGGIGAFFANPGDLAMVRMQADGKQLPELRRNYKHIFDALGRIVKEEGVLSLWKGVWPTVNRAMIVTVGHLAAYDEAKGALLATGVMQDNVATHLAASFTAAFVASALSHPVDVAKTRLMNMSQGGPQYTGMINCMFSTVKVEGPLALYKGFMPTLVRQVPYMVTTWLVVEQVKKAW